MTARQVQLPWQTFPKSIVGDRAQLCAQLGEAAAVASAMRAARPRQCESTTRPVLRESVPQPRSE